MNSDELGAKGESRFAEICADAGLICNDSKRDRAGWDFVVDFPIQSQANLSMDHRRAPISCLIQVKTIKDKNNRFSIRLNMAERLAKDNRPCFVYVFKVNEMLEFSGFYLIHILNDRLASILKRLRMESQLGNEKINNKEISFTINECEGIEYGGTHLKNTIERVCSAGMAAYGRIKSEQLIEIGYKTPPVHAEMTLIAEDEELLEKAFLEGGVPIPVKSFKAFETRFGITLPITEVTGGHVEIHPSPSSECILTLRNPNEIEPFVSKAKIYFSSLFKKHSALISNDVLKLKIIMDELETNVQITIKGASDLMLRCSEWLEYWKMLRILSCPNFTIEIAPDSDRPELEFSMQKNFEVDPRLCDWWIDYLSGIENIFKVAAVKHEPTIDFLVLKKCHENHIRIQSILRKEEINIPNRYDFNHPQVSQLHGRPTLITELLEIGGVLIAYYLTAKINVNQRKKTGKVKLTEVMFKKMCELPSATEYEKFIANAKRKEKIDAVITANYDASPHLSNPTK
ncbi:hypothetical protein [Chromobacterium subtsugae]|uniref:hypothetical protein n=1 Tax=Chromobacterium subtsugae TaxID=251747 RepID=UPI000B10C518|nr:hypothetical protein [Chromobacterium subtsugae]